MNTGNGYIEGRELDNFLLEFVTSIHDDKVRVGASRAEHEAGVRAPGCLYWLSNNRRATPPHALSL